MKLTTENLDAVGGTLPATPTTTTTARVRRTRRAKPPRAERNIHPRIQAANDKRNAEVANIRKEDASARMLRVILEKRVPKMVEADRRKLVADVSKTLEPELPLGLPN